MKLPKLEPLSARYRKMLAAPELLGEGEALDLVSRLFVNCEGAGRVEGAFQMLEALSSFLTPGVRALGTTLILKLKAESDAQLK